MANDVAALPPNLLTTKQYEEQQAKLLAQDEQLDRDAFLKLFTTQLKNQNPLDPMENEAFVAQLAQFSSLEAMTGVRTSMDSMAADSKSSRFLLGSSLIGKKLERVSNLVTVAEGEKVTSKANLPELADSGVFSIYDAATNELVYKEDFNRMPPGAVDLTWNGQNQEGDQMPAGQYRFEFTANRGGNLTNVPLINKQTIAAVSWDKEVDELEIEMEDGSKLNIAEVGRIEN
ncbi:MAG: flagellar hook assembly protein FlgD [Pseudohongiellaceae bacterium]